MATIVLHGDLQQFGGTYKFSVASPAEAIRACCSQLKGFKQRLREGEFRIIRKNQYRERDLPVEALSGILAEHHDLHIMPVVAGAKRGGVGKAILGVAVIAAAFYFAPAVATVAIAGETAGGAALAASMGASAFTVLGASVSYATIAGFGASMLLGGVAQMLSPSPNSDGSMGLQGQATNPSFIFNGAENVTEQGNVVPVVYGEFECGSVVVSSALTVENI